MTSKGHLYRAIGIEAPAITYKIFEEDIMEMPHLWNAANSGRSDPKSF